MNLYTALYRRLTQDVTLGALIGTRVTNGFGLVGTLPQVQIDVDTETDSSIEVWGCKNFTVDVKIVAATVESREYVRRLVFGLLDRQSWTDSTAAVAVSASLLITENSYQTSISGDVERLYYSADQSYNFIAQET